MEIGGTFWRIIALAAVLHVVLPCSPNRAGEEEKEDPEGGEKEKGRNKWKQGRFERCMSRIEKRALPSRLKDMAPSRGGGEKKRREEEGTKIGRRCFCHASNSFLNMQHCPSSESLFLPEALINPCSHTRTSAAALEAAVCICWCLHKALPGTSVLAMKRGPAASRKRQRKASNPFQSVNYLSLHVNSHSGAVPIVLRLSASTAICNRYLRLEATDGIYTNEFSIRGHSRKMMTTALAGLPTAL